MAIEKGEWIIGTEHSREHSDFLANLNDGKYSGIDIAANLELARNLHRRGRVIRMSSESQALKEMMRKSSSFDRLENEMKNVRQAVEAVQAEVRRKPTIIPSGRNQVIIEEGMRKDIRIVDVK